jgi:Xaa-Pro aminopeptidase
MVPKEEIAKRIRLFKDALLTQGAAVTWIAHTTDLLYLTGSIQDGVLLVYPDREPVFYVKKSLKRAQRESPIEAAPYPGSKQLYANINAALGRNDGGLGMALDVTPASVYLRMCKSLPESKPVDVSGIIRLQKAVKSDWEHRQIALATKQVEIIFDEVRAIIKPGMTELDLTGWIEGRLRALGHSGPVRIRRPGMELAMLMAASGDSALYPTNFDGPVGGEGPYPVTPSGPGWKKLAAGETVMTDIVSAANGYHSDNARTFFLGNDIPANALAAHQFCVDCLAFIESRLKPGAVCEDIFNATDAWAKKTGEPEGFMGYGENRVRFFGHGVGLELDEFPVIAKKVSLALEQGMVIAVEPKAFLPGIGPVGVENTYKITQDGCESFCKTDRSLQKL